MMAKSFRIHIVIVLLTTCGYTLCSVDWRLGQDVIIIGQPLQLKCKLAGSIKNVTRQWTGAENNRLICFNGVAPNPAKYREITESLRRYTLQISDTSEDDLDYPYTCHFGFEYSEKMLSVSPKNLLALPDGNSTRTAYLRQKNNYTLNIDFYRIYPIPECHLNKMGKFMKLDVGRTAKTRILYNVSLHLESDEPLHECGKSAYVTCKIGNRTSRYDIQHQFHCKDGPMWTTVVVVCTSIVAMSVLLFLTFCIRKSRRKIHHKNNIEIQHAFGTVYFKTMMFGKTIHHTRGSQTNQSHPLQMQYEE